MERNPMKNVIKLATIPVNSNITTGFGHVDYYTIVEHFVVVVRCISK